MFSSRRGNLLHSFGLLTFSTCALVTASTDSPLYLPGDIIPVTCLNRTETGEHIVDPNGNLQYIPFETCLETSKPLQLTYASPTPIKCTITITDPLFHLLEYYIHNDAPLTCRVPSTPGAATLQPSEDEKEGAMGAQSTHFTPLVISLAGTLQLSHLHVANEVNVVLHTAPRPAAQRKKTNSAPALPVMENTITTAAAYSRSPHLLNQRLTIGQDLVLTFYPRWYVGDHLSPTNATTYHSLGSTLLYMLLSAAASATVCIVYFRGVELPRRLKWHGVNRVGGSGQGLPVYKGYGYGVQQGNGGAGGFGFGGSGGRKGD